MKLLAYAVWLLALATSGSAWATTEKPIVSYSREVWTTRDGLPHNQVNSIAQTREGYLWFATWEGLVRYNGQEFRTFGRQNVPALHDNGIRSVNVADNGDLVVATSRGGVSVLHGDTWKTYDRHQGLSHDETMVAIEDHIGRLWVATESAGIVRLAGPQTKYFRVADGLPSDVMYSLIEDSEGVVWAGTGDGLVRIEADRIQAFGKDAGLPPGDVFCVAQAPDGRLYVGTEHGVYVGQGGRFQLVRPDFPNEAIPSLNFDAQGGLWIGTVNRGLMRLTERGLERFDADAGLPNNRVPSIFNDREGNIWVGTNAGLLRFADTPFVTLDTHQGLSDDYVRTVLQASDGTIWIGTARGLDQWKDGHIVTPGGQQGLPEDAILSLAEAGDHSIWIGMYSTGLLRWQDGAVREHLDADHGLSGNQVRALTTTADGTLWIGTSRGLQFMRLGEHKLNTLTRKDGLPRDFVLSLHAAANGRLWVGTANGLAYVESGKVTAINLTTYDDAQDVFGISEDADGTMWFATDRGLLRLRNGKFALIGVRNGLPVDSIFQAVTDSYGNFWLSSNSGVIYARRDKIQAVADGRSKSLSYQQFAEPDGMASAQCNGGSGPAAVRTRDGSIWIATAKGVAIVQPDELAKYQLAPPPVVIEGIRVDDHVANGKDTLLLPPGTRKLELDYVSLSYRTPEQIRYRYRLEGFDNGWVERKQMRNAQYTNLPPGRYRFQVSAAQGGSGWSPETASLNFEIQPRFYQRPWFLPTTIILLAIFLYGLYRARVRHLETREHELSDLVGQRTHALSEKAEQLELLNQTIRQQSEAFERQARTDALTGLPNRRNMDEQLEMAFQSAVHENQSLCFGLLDIDYFKRINDNYSHDVGDQALKLVAKVMLEEMGRSQVARWRGGERVARWGGEEFALLFPGMDMHAAKAEAERLRLMLEAADCEAFAPGLRITASIGIAERTGLAHHERLVTRADQKLYEAKHAGRNRVMA